MPTLERILKAAVNDLATGRREPHCWSAHVPGKGYVDEGDDPETRTEYLRQLARAAQSEAENMGYAPGYAEPGYTDPDKGIVFANWNVFPKDLDRILERAGYEVEWSDEWSTCEDCNKAVRTQADSYGWQRAYVMPDECSIVCLDCVDWESYLESLEDDSDKACNRNVDPKAYGYERLSEADAYESGLHPGQNDNPDKILKELQAQGKTRILFRVSRVQQFDAAFETWIKVTPACDHEPHLVCESCPDPEEIA